jgi:hypothetical protein
LESLSELSATNEYILFSTMFRPTPQLFPFVNRLGHDGNRPEILKYSVSVPNVPGSNYRDSFTVYGLHPETMRMLTLLKGFFKRQLSQGVVQLPEVSISSRFPE